ncbi:unnamed protein product [Arabidopsis arenosa]|uniref:Squalene cyclase N-terminal domain-containing protein n=1 Tax=Arabidopsis arenosa TaxID=38785 RepID=A0A8S2B4J0_ARAAE|nr:unnamed protein product [Arabidopsis arenosa]
MWRLRIGAKAENGTHLFTTNNYVGRQIWRFDANAGSPQELAEVEEARRNFSDNKSRYKASADLLWRMQKIPRVRVEDAAKIRYEDAKTALRRGLHYFTALQADDGHWPADNSGPNFFIAPLVICLYITGHLEKIFTVEHRIELLRYMYNHQNEDGGWGLHVESPSIMFCTVINYICLRIVGVEAGHDDQGSACAKARKWILDHGGATYTPLMGKACMSVLGVYDWSGCKPIPPEFWFLPSSFPVNGGRSLLFTLIFTRFVLERCPYLLREYSKPMPFNKLIRQAALRTNMKLLHYQDEANRYITGGSVPKAFHMLACWVEDPEGDYFKNILLESLISYGLARMASKFRVIMEVVTAWEPADGKTWLEWFSPVEFVEDTVIEHEYVECTGSAIVALTQFSKQFPEFRKKEVERFITKGVKYIEDLQMKDGSWCGNWECVLSMGPSCRKRSCGCREDFQ